MELFNDFIGNFQPRDFFIGGAKYAWSNKHKFPTLVKLDRILATTSWDMNYTNSYAWAKARIGSDHNPLILDTGDKGFLGQNTSFFRKSGFTRKNFPLLVKEKWNTLKNSHPQFTYSLYF
jgi:hypothetical protein